MNLVALWTLILWTGLTKAALSLYISFYLSTIPLEKSNFPNFGQRKGPNWRLIDIFEDVF